MFSGLLPLLSLWHQFQVFSALDLTVYIHYPERNSAVEFCGFNFKVEAASGVDPSNTTSHASAKHESKDLYVAHLSMANEYLSTEAVVAVSAAIPQDPDIFWGQLCQAVCPKLGPQGLITNAGPYTKTGSLQMSNVLHLWPDFGCRSWSNVDVSFNSSAIRRQVDIRIRLPAAPQENALARPSQQLPPVMFRLNSEWYFDYPGKVYDSWHSLMVTGEMEPVVMVEVYIKGVGWQNWNDQPIYTSDKLRKTCGRCDPELQFICDSWEKSGYAMYAGGNHNFGHAAAFFEELWKMVMPRLLRQLPQRTDTKPVRTGAWGYCIGGLAAWNAITALPHLYNIAYLGSPALDFNCGDPFRMVSNISYESHGSKPKIYIDSGTDEGYEMNTQSLLLFHKLQKQGLVEGHDLFYSRAPFGTHQERMFLRRALKGLLIMFGSGSPQIESSQPSPFFSGLTYTYQPLSQAWSDSKLDPTMVDCVRAIASMFPLVMIFCFLRCRTLKGRASGKKTSISAPNGPEGEANGLDDGLLGG